MLIVFLMLLIVAVGIGTVVGFIKGYTKCSAWGGAALFTVLIARPVSEKIAESVAPSDSFNFSGLYIIITAVGILLVLSFLFMLVKRYIASAVDAGVLLSHYKNYDRFEENTEQVLAALDNDDKKAYRKAVKHKIKDRAGPWGLVNRIFGAITCALDGVSIVFVIEAILLLFVDFSHIEFLTNTFGEVINHGYWTDFGSWYALDFLLVVLVGACVRSGYKRGVLSMVGVLAVLGLLGVSGYAAYHLAFNEAAFVGMAESFANGPLAGMLGDNANALQNIGLDGVTIGKYVVMVCIFLVFLVFVIILGIFLGKWIDKIKTSVVVGAIDGVFGAIISTVVVIAILTFLGAVVYTLHDIEALSQLNSFMEKSRLCNAMYALNPIGGLGFIQALPFRSWFGG